MKVYPFNITSRNGPPFVMELRSQCSGVHLSLQIVGRPEEPGNSLEYPRGFLFPIPEALKNMEERPLLRPHNMELRSECSGFHDALMRFGNITASLPSQEIQISEKILDAALEGSPKHHNMELRAQCCGIHESLMQGIVGPYQDRFHIGYQSPVMQIPKKSSDLGSGDSPDKAHDIPHGKQDRPLMTPHNMELRSECSGFHDALMRFGNISASLPSLKMQIPDKTFDEELEASLKHQNMELRADCCGIHQSLMQGIIGPHQDRSHINL